MDINELSKTLKVSTTRLFEVIKECNYNFTIKSNITKLQIIRLKRILTNMPFHCKKWDCKHRSKCLNTYTIFDPYCKKYIQSSLSIDPYIYQSFENQFLFYPILYPHKIKIR